MATEQTLITRPGLNIELAIEEWIANKLRTRSGSQKTETAYRDTLLSFRDTLQQAGLDLDADPRDVARLAPFWASSRHPDAKRAGEIANSTYNQRLAVVSSFYSFLRKMYRLDIENPIQAVEKRRVQAYEYAQPLSAESVALRLSCIDTSLLEGKRNYALLTLGVMTGRRAAELVSVRWGDIEERDGVYIVTFHCKGGKTKRDALDVDLAAAMLDYLHALYGQDLRGLPSDAPVFVSFSRRNPGKQLSSHTLNDLCENYFGTGKIHTLRHTFAKAMEKAGATLSEIQDRLGHEDIATTARYLKALSSEENKHAGILAERFGIRRAETQIWEWTSNLPSR